MRSCETSCRLHYPIGGHDNGAASHPKGEAHLRTGCGAHDNEAVPYPAQEIKPASGGQVWVALGRPGMWESCSRVPAVGPLVCETEECHHEEQKKKRMNVKVELSRKSSGNQG